MQYKLSLRSLIGLVVGSAILMMLLAFALQNQQQGFLMKLTTVAISPIIIFALYAIAYLITLPIGLLNSVYLATKEKPVSPFSTDRLPKKVVHVDDGR